MNFNQSQSFSEWICVVVGRNTWRRSEFPSHWLSWRLSYRITIVSTLEVLGLNQDAYVSHFSFDLSIRTKLGVFHNKINFLLSFGNFLAVESKMHYIGKFHLDSLKAELLQLNHNEFICLRSFTYKKVGNTYLCKPGFNITIIGWKWWVILKYK